MKRLALFIIFIILGATLAAGSARNAFYYTQLRTSAGDPLHWKTKPVKFVINDAGSDNVPDGSDDLAFRLAFQTWQDIAGSSISFQEVTSATERARTDYASDDIHLILFDENLSTGLIPSGSGIIALTPVSFFTSPPSVAGEIADGDIVFNGLNFTFSTDLSVSTIDIQSVAAHEIGHFIGLDHEALGADTMYPFSGTQQFNQRTVTSDDAAGAEATYPSGSKGKISGTVKRSSDSSVVKGAHVWARSTTDGRVATSSFTGEDGTFLLTGLAAGNYRVGIEAIDFPVTSGNLGTNTIGTVQTDFQSGQSGVITVAGTSTTAAGDITVGASPIYNISSPTRVTTLHAGEGKVIHFAGTLPLVANTEMTMPDTGSAFTLGYAAGNNLTVTATAGALPGFYDILMRDTTNDQKVLYSGFIEVLPALSTVSAVNPAAGATAGGTTVVITGTNFSGSPIVIFGDALATDVSVDSSTQLTVKTPAHAANIVDVVVQDASGQEARKTGAYTFGDATQPDLTQIFPTSGSTSGGSVVTLTGTSFVQGASVKFGVTNAPSVTFVSSTQLVAIAPALAAGTYDVTVVNPGALAPSSTITSAYTAVGAPSPGVSSVTPANVNFLGGELVTISGSNFVNGLSLKLFSNIIDGSGGISVTPASVSANQITFVAPAGSVGDASIFIQNPSGLSFVGNGKLEYQYSVNGNGTLTGNISSTSDTDIVYVNVIAGTKLTITVTQNKSTLKPKVRILDESSVVFMSTDSGDAEFNSSFASATTKSAAIKNYTINSTQRIQIVISGLTSTTGKYKCVVKETPPASAKSVKASKLAVGPGTVGLNFDAKPGSTLKGKLSAKNGLQAQVSAFAGPGGSLLGDSTVTTAIVTSATGSSISFNTVPLAQFGSYVLTIGPAAATTGLLNGTLSIVAPKTAKTATEQ